MHPYHIKEIENKPGLKNFNLNLILTCLSIQIKYFFFFDMQGTVKKCISSSTSFLQIGQILSSGFL